MAAKAELVNDLQEALTEGILKRWYPLVIDGEQGGYFTNVTAEWTRPPKQEKMIVTQARHVWTTSKLASFTGQAAFYQGIARHGYAFLHDVMWDKEFGGFYQIRSREGGMSDVWGWRDEKRTYGNAFAIYALASLHAQTHDPDVLEFAKKAFAWVEDHAYDPDRRGYFQFLTREGKQFDRSSAYKTSAADRNELGFKDQNSSIHLMEAYTELYRVWKDEKLRDRLEGILTLIRDTMVAPQGYLQLFFHPDWTPVSFRDASEEVRRANYGLEHVSFGHDYETAFLMLEASHALGLTGDVKTLRTAKKMLDHALTWGWDKNAGGFYDGGYYFRGKDECTIIKDTKNWWAQAEALNALLLFSRIFPEGRYDTYFLKQWEYVNRFIIDHEHGDWFEGGVDKEPQFKTGLRSHIWKCTYHTGRSLMNCIALLGNGAQPAPGIRLHRQELEELVRHWREVAGGEGNTSR